FRDELAEVLAKHHVAIGVSVPEVVPDATDDLAKYWSEWQDLNLRPPRPERGREGAAPVRFQFAPQLLPMCCPPRFSGERLIYN
ncbi:MAG: hypothetical protein WAK04_15985, partial [Xanthobacteraceae bacterium]